VNCGRLTTTPSGQKEFHAMSAKVLSALSTPRNLKVNDLRTLFSFPTTEEMASLDAVEVACLTCDRAWEVILDDHAVSRGTASALLSHARSHQPGNKPGMRRVR